MFLISSRVGAGHSISASPELAEPQPIAQAQPLHQDKTPWSQNRYIRQLKQATNTFIFNNGSF